MCVQGEIGTKEEPDQSVVSTKSKILEIIQFIMDVRLDLRITNLLVLYKKHFQELEADIGSAPSKLVIVSVCVWGGGGGGCVHELLLEWEKLVSEMNSLAKVLF